MPPLENQNPVIEAPASEKRRRDDVRDPLEALAKRMNTNLRDGLSPKNAEKRLEEQEGNSLFDAPPPRLLSCVKSVLAEPVMWLLLAVCLVALFFNRLEIGLFSALMLILHGVLCVILKYKTLCHHARMQVYDVPLARVIRNRRLMRVRGDRLVPGDVILLRRGDVIPADARLISAHRLLVEEDTLDGDEKNRETLLLEKDAEVIPEAFSPRHSPIHMVYAGGLVKRGRGRALVIATSSKTHLGGLISRVPSAYPWQEPLYVKRLKKLMSTVNLILAVAVIPLTALGILTQGGRYELLDLFMSTLALSVLTLTEHLAILTLYGYTTAGLSSARDADTENSVEIRTPETLNELSRMSHLILLGTAALHDGSLSPLYAVTCGRTYRLDEGTSDPALQAFAEKVFLLSEGQSDRLQSGAYSRFPSLDRISALLCEQASADTEALMLRLDRLEAQGDAVQIQYHHSQKSLLFMTDDPDVLYTCTLARAADTKMPMDERFLAYWGNALKRTYDRGLRAQILVSETESERCLEGFIALSVGLCRKTKGCIQGMEADGLRVVSFLRDVLPEDEKALSDAGFLDNAPSVDLSDKENKIPFSAALASGTRSFVNATTEDVLSYMEAVRREGGRVGVLSVERIDMPLLEAADVAFTCAPSAYKEALLEDQPLMCGSEGTRPDGDPDSATASDLCRRNAHVILRRCGAHGGGVCGIRRAGLASRQLVRGLWLSMRYLLLSQALRVLMLTLPLVTGVAYLPAPVLLISGLLMDALAVLCFVGCDPEAGKDRGQGTPLDILTHLPRVFKAELILSGSTAAFSYAVALVTRLLGGSAYGDMAYFLALSLLATQIVIFATSGRIRRRRSIFIPVLMACVYVGLLSVALASGLHVLWCLLLPLLQPLLWLMGYGICRKLKLLPDS